MSTFLLVSLRTGELGPAVANAEFNDVLRATGLPARDVEMRVIDGADARLGDDLSSFAGIIVGGSSLNVTNSESCPWQKQVSAQLREVLAAGVPVFFVCFGLSWLVDALGGTVGRSSPEASGGTLVHVTDAAANDPLLQGFPESFAALTGHTENPEILPAELEVLATGTTTPVQLVRYGEHVWAAQFHAEMDPAAMKTRMDFFHGHGYFREEEYDAIVATLPSVDVTWANELMRRFERYCRARLKRSSAGGAD